MASEERVIFRERSGSSVTNTWMAASDTHDRTSYLSPVSVYKGTGRPYCRASNAHIHHIHATYTILEDDVAKISDTGIYFVMPLGDDVEGKRFRCIH